MLKKALLSLMVVCSFLAADSGASMIKVLILDDVFQAIPGKDEEIEPMGKISGDLLVSGTRYSGNIEVWKGSSGMYLINELPIEEYVKNVVGAEVGASWDMEALKAQAVIARTYALYQKSAKGSTKYDLTSSVLHQVYKGSAVDARISYAVMNTEGEVITFEGKLIEALYHSTCGGKTENPEEVFGKSYPYLKPVESNCEISPYWIWEKRIPFGEIEKALGIAGLKDISIESRTATKRAKAVAFSHEGGKSVVKSNDLRKALGWNRLPSTNFEVSVEDGTAIFEGKGYGHGCGLCQWSALEFARTGMNYREILSFFYPGTAIQSYENL